MKPVERNKALCRVGWLALLLMLLLASPGVRYEPAPAGPLAAHAQSQP